jgi:hypothetical protein
MMMIAGDHRDWIRPLNSALERLIRARPRTARDIATALESPSLRPFANRSRSPYSADIVLRSHDDGNLVGLASVLVQVGEEDTATRYPRSAAGLAAALLQWDKRLKSLPRPGAGPSTSARPMA